MKTKIKGLVSNVIFKNSFYTFIVQTSNFILPLLVIPYITRILGRSNFGVVAYIQSFAVLLTVFTDYGFTLSATREIAQNKDDNNRINRIVNEIVNTKIFLILIVLMVTIILFLLIPFLHSVQSYLFVTLFLIAANGLNATWYYLGIENLLFPTKTTIIFKFIFIILVFLFIKEKNDGVLYLFFLSLTTFIPSFINNLNIYKYFNYKLITLLKIFDTLKNSFNLFFFKGAVSLYTSANNFILGSILLPTEVGVFAGAEKIVKAIIGIWMPLSNAAYPRINYLLINEPRRAKKMIFKILVLYFFTSVVVFLIFFFYANWIVKLILGSEFIDSVPILKTLSPIIIFIALSNVTGILWLLPNKKDKQFNLIIIIAGILNICLAYPLILKFGPIGMAISVLISEFFVMISCFIIVFKSKEINFV